MNTGENFQNKTQGFGMSCLAVTCQEVYDSSFIKEKESNICDVQETASVVLTSEDV